MKLDALMWNDIYTWTYSQRAYDIYKMVFSVITGTLCSEDPLPVPVESINVEFIDALGNRRELERYRIAGPSNQSKFVVINDNDNLKNYDLLKNADIFISINEAGMVVVRSIRDLGYLKYDADSLMFDKWRSNERLRNARRFVLRELMCFSRWMKNLLSKDELALNSAMLSQYFKFKMEDKTVEFSVNDVDYLYYLIENEGKIGWRGAAKRDAENLKELLGEPRDMLTAMCYRTLRNEWRKVIEETEADILSKKDELKKFLNESIPSFKKLFFENVEIQKKTAFEKLETIMKPMGYSSEDIMKEVDMEIDIGTIQGKHYAFWFL